MEVREIDMSDGILLEEKINTEDEEDDFFVHIPRDTIELFYCEVFKKPLAVPPGVTELTLEIIPSFSCYNCNSSCSLQQTNKAYLTDLIHRILNSRNGYRKYFRGLLYDYKVRYVQ